MLEQCSVTEPTTSKILERTTCEVDDDNTPSDGSSEPTIDISRIDESKLKIEIETTLEQSVSPKPFSIVPYDDDSTTSSQINMDQNSEDQEKETEKDDDSVSAELMLLESASRSSSAENIESNKDEDETIQDQAKDLSNTMTSDAAKENLIIEKFVQKKEDSEVVLIEKEETLEKTEKNEENEEKKNVLNENHDENAPQGIIVAKSQDNEENIMGDESESKESLKTYQIETEKKLEKVRNTQVENHPDGHEQNLYPETSLQLENIADIPLPSDIFTDQKYSISEKVVEEAGDIMEQENMIEENDLENISEHEESSVETSISDLTSLHSKEFINHGTRKLVTPNDLGPQETKRENSLINETVEITSEPEVSASESLVPNFKTPVELEITSNSIEIEENFSNKNKKRIEEHLSFEMETDLNESIVNTKSEMKVVGENSSAGEKKSVTIEAGNHKEETMQTKSYQATDFSENKDLNFKETENTEKGNYIEIEKSTSEEIPCKEIFLPEDETELRLHKKQTVSDILGPQEISDQPEKVVSTSSDNEEDLSEDLILNEAFSSKLQKVCEIESKTGPLEATDTNDLLTSEHLAENAVNLKASPAEQTQFDEVIKEPETICVENKLINQEQVEKENDVEKRVKGTEKLKKQLLVTVQNDSENLAKENLEKQKSFTVEKELDEQEKIEDVPESSSVIKIDKGQKEENPNEIDQLEPIDSSDDEDVNDFDGANDSSDVGDEFEKESDLTATATPDVVEKQPEPACQIEPVEETSFSEKIKIDNTDLIEKKSAEILNKNEIGPKFVEVVSTKCVELVQDKKVAEEKIVEEKAAESDKEAAENGKELNKLPVTRKRKISETKSVSESDSDSNIVADAVSHDISSDDEEIAQKKKPRMRVKTASPRKMPPRKVAKKAEEEIKKDEVIAELPEEKQKTPEKKLNDEESKETLQSLKFDYDENDDVAANVAAIKTMICKEANTGLKKGSSDDEDSDERTSVKRGRRRKRSRYGKNNVAVSSSDEDPLKITKADSKKTKIENAKSPPGRKKRETGKYYKKFIILSNKKSYFRHVETHRQVTCDRCNRRKSSPTVKTNCAAKDQRGKRTTSDGRKNAETDESGS